MQLPWQHVPRRPEALLWTLAIAMLVPLLAACGGGTDRPTGAGIYVPADGATTTQGLDVRTGVAITTGYGVEPSDDYLEIEQLVQSFLNGRVTGVSPTGHAVVLVVNASGELLTAYPSLQ